MCNIMALKGLNVIYLAYKKMYFSDLTKIVSILQKY